MDNVYTMSQIKEMWEDYKNARCWVAQKKTGKKVVLLAASKLNSTDDYLKCEMKLLRKVMSFPKYIEINYAY